MVKQAQSATHTSLMSMVSQYKHSFCRTVHFGKYSHIKINCQIVILQTLIDH